MKRCLNTLAASLLMISLSTSAQGLSSPITPANQSGKWEQISEFTHIDKGHTQRQRDSIDELARRFLGSQLRGDKDNDLRVLQRLLDRGIVANDDTAKLQAMGVVLGDVIAQELGLTWVIYEDEEGRNRALRYKQHKDVLFPVTMISRRAETGADVDIMAIYEKAVQRYKPLLPALPYS
ncbi:MAG TPA: DUF3806 domain-containing protein [Pseudomonadales bacterium]|nr:DUF3806 domain-containing protein [Pseudomonadales bacterium]